MLLVWHHPSGSPPSFEVPELDAMPITRLSRTTTACLEFDGHPVATSENSVDLSHLAEVHRYTEVVMVRPFSANGTEASASYSIWTRPIGIPGDGRMPALRRATTHVRFDVRLFGLGVSLVEATIPRVGARTRQLVLATPVAPGRIEFRLAMQVVHEGGRLRSIVERIAARIAPARSYTTCTRTSRSGPISGTYSRPALAHGDGPIVPYRRWARQFLEHDG